MTDVKTMKKDVWKASKSMFIRPQAENADS